jgi:hypothetical protein
MFSFLPLTHRSFSFFIGESGSKVGSTMLSHNTSTNDEPYHIEYHMNRQRDIKANEMWGRPEKLHKYHSLARDFGQGRVSGESRSHLRRKY